MRKNDNIEKLIDQLIASDEQPSEEKMGELRQRLKQKVTHMTSRGRNALYVCLGGGILMLLGFIALLIAANGQQEITWFAQVGFGTLITGAAVTLVGCIGLLMFRGLGFGWARHDFQEAAIAELSLQVERLSQKLDALSKGT